MTFNFFVNNLLTYRDKRLKGLKATVLGLMSFYAVCALGAFSNVGVAYVLFEKQYVWWLSWARRHPGWRSLELLAHVHLHLAQIGQRGAVESQRLAVPEVYFAHPFEKLERAAAPPSARKNVRA
jgi:hypothetical protein